MADDLIRAYPEAKVIMLRRDTEAWIESIDLLLINPCSQVMSWFVRVFLRPLTGLLKYAVFWDGLRSLFETSDPDEMRERAQMAHKKYYDTIR